MTKKNRKKFTEVYIAVNLVNGKKYIGITSCGLTKRKQAHIRRAFKGAEKNNILHRAIRKYGSEAFSFSILKGYSNFDEALKEEIRLIGLLEPEYNLTKGGEGHLGYSPSTETRLKISRAHNGNKYNLGRKTGETTKEKLRLLGLKNRDTFIKNVGTKGQEASRVPVICLNDARIFNSVIEAAHHYQAPHADISKMCKGVKRFQTVKGRKFAYYTGQLIAVQPLEFKDSKKRVVCLNDGRVFDKIKDAARFYKVARTSISAICREKQRTVNNLTFMYLPDPSPLTEDLRVAEFKKKHFEKKKKVLCVEDNRIFSSIKECAAFYGVTETPITECCHKKRKICKRLKKTFSFCVGNVEAA